ncbi:MAG: putative oxidoreductase, partial [Actinomycetota bacterium]|nr:putative oxidoreductase [Actinomycetota bacterium]
TPTTSPPRSSSSYATRTAARDRGCMSEAVTRVLTPRTTGTAAWITTVVRVATGVLFITFSLGKFVDHAQESADFDHYGIPVPEVATYLVGTLELGCGALLVVGLFTRPAALLLALNLLGAIATAGRVDGGTFHLGVAPAMLLAMLYLLWAGCGRLALDRRLASRPAT